MPTERMEHGALTAALTQTSQGQPGRQPCEPGAGWVCQLGSSGAGKLPFREPEPEDGK